jgi:hypothetical protein
MQSQSDVYICQLMYELFEYLFDKYEEAILFFIYMTAFTFIPVSYNTALPDGWQWWSSYLSP